MFDRIWEETSKKEENGWSSISISDYLYIDFQIYAWSSRWDWVKKEEERTWKEASMKQENGVPSGFDLGVGYLICLIFYKCFVMVI